MKDTTYNIKMVTETVTAISFIVALLILRCYIECAMFAIHNYVIYKIALIAAYQLHIQYTYSI